ncbi:MAG TPA: hypothetical protein VNF05_01975 [Acidimicrobiales bacterium]|nr:hypothetical protein [Acidimicrobiales bacterium]
MATFRRASLLSTSLALFLTALVVGTPLAANASVANPTVASILKAAKTAIVKQSGVHVTVATVSGKIDSSVVADIGQASGAETYRSGNESFTITVTPTYAYLSGSLKGLTTLMGLTAAEQKKIGKKSMAMKKGSSYYTTFAANLTSGTTFASLLPATKGTSLLSKRDKKTNGYQLTWTAKATSTQPKSTTVMTFSSGKKTLPLKDAVSTSTGKSETTFTKWGEKVSVKVPSSTIPYTQVIPAS